MAQRHLRAPLVLGVLAAVALASCTRHSPRTISPPTTAVPGADVAALPPPDPGSHPRGGTVRVAVWGEPDPAAPTLAGAGVRALVLPQLFVARADGRWETSLVEPGTDRTAADRRSAQFRLRRGAAWSDGTPVTADDLARTADRRFVGRVSADAGGVITVVFTQALPGWRRLWSGTDSVAAPRPGVWGGPFVVSSVTPGLETVLRPNPRWPGPGPFLDELRLVVVPDADTERRLLAAGEVDVAMPLAATNRTPQLGAAVGGASVAVADGGGWSTALVLDGRAVNAAVRRAVVATIDREQFVDVLLRDEAVPVTGMAGAGDRTWATVGPGDAKAIGKVVLTGVEEEPMTALLERAMQKRARAAGGELELRNGQADEVEQWLAARDYQAALVPLYDGPSPCWRCRWSGVDDALARAADAGEPGAVLALEAKLRNEARIVPLWRGRTVVAWRASVVHGVDANGYALDAAWNAQQWWR